MQMLHTEAQSVRSGPDAHLFQFDPENLKLPQISNL